MNWVINVPVWGEGYLQKFLNFGVPSINTALARANALSRSRWIIHNDQDRHEIQKALDGAEIEFRSIPNAVNSTRRLGEADRYAIHSAAAGDYIMFVNADMVVSHEVFSACEEHFAEGKHFISCPAIRTLDLPPPIGASARNLLEWSWTNKHQFTSDCIWDRGKVSAPPYLLFEDSDGVVMHAFDLHPLAISKYHEMEYVGPTASEIIMMFTAYDTYIVASPEMAIAEPCSELEYGRLDHALNLQTAIHWGRHFSLQMQIRQFRRQIRLVGYGLNPMAQHVADLVLEGINTVPESFAPRQIARDTIIDLALKMPSPVRQMIPKPFREWMLKSL